MAGPELDEGDGTAGGDGAPAHEYRWALPSALLGDAGEGGRVRHSMRDWIVDALMFLLVYGGKTARSTENHQLGQAPDPVPLGNTV